MIKIDDVPFVQHARDFIQDFCTHNGVRTICFWSGSFWLWNGQWLRESDKAIEALINVWSRQKKYDYRPRIIEELRRMVSLEAMLSSNVQQNQWLTTEHMPEVIAFQNGLLNLDRFVATGTYELLPKDPRWFSSQCCPYSFNSSAVCDRWYETLDNWFGEDEDLKFLVQEIFGYLLTGDKSQEKMFVFLGRPGSGKSTCVGALRSVVGEDNTHASSIENLGTRFGTAMLADKSICELPDQRSLGRNQNTSLQNLLGFIGNDKLRAEFKGKDEFALVPPTRFIMSCNDMPNLGDQTGAFLRRLVMVPFERSFAEKPDKGLKDDLKAEAPGIAVWALQGLRRLRKNGSFSEGMSSLEAKAAYEDELNPVSAFVRECLELSPNHAITKNRIYEIYTEFCKRTNTKAQAYNVFFRQLWGANLTLRSARVTINGSREQAVSGCRVKSAWLKRPQ